MNSAFLSLLLTDTDYKSTALSHRVRLNFLVFRKPGTANSESIHHLFSRGSINVCSASCLWTDIQPIKAVYPQFPSHSRQADAMFVLSGISVSVGAKTPRC